MENLQFWNSWAKVPENAKRKISGGKLNGKTDINPQWRLKVLTETFGPVGFGWYTEITEHWTEEVETDFNPQNGYATKESTAWVTINLYIKNPETGEWSKPIVGTGGSKQCGKGKGDGIDDEAFKMAETDAISVACKKLGIGADVYWEAGTSKYSSTPASTSIPAAKPVAKPAEAKPRPVIEKGNPLWMPAIEYCRTNNCGAEALRQWYTISDATINEMQKVLDFQKDLKSAR